MDVMEEAEVMALCINNNESNSSSSNNTANNSDQQCAHTVVKGKRTKRQRLQSSLAPATATASTSSNSSDVEVSSSTTEEDEDMANCLILLARGRAAPDEAVPLPTLSAEKEAVALVNRTPTEKFTSRRFNEAATTTEEKTGFFVYECKTCNKCFPSFQALGGHRASHKKPKIAAPAEEKKASTELVDEDTLQLGMNSFSKAVMAPNSNTSISGGNTKSRVHECAICGSEFSSGQALGGHMRRHRPLTVAESPEMKKERNVLSLDLNLPAPSDDSHVEFTKPPATGVAFQFESKRPHVFSASALVGCHY